MSIIILFTFVGGLCATLFIYSKKSKTSKRVILYICEVRLVFFFCTHCFLANLGFVLLEQAVLLVYMVLQAWDMSFQNCDSGRGGFQLMYGFGWFGLWLLVYR